MQEERTDNNSASQQQEGSDDGDVQQQHQEPDASAEVVVPTWNVSDAQPGQSSVAQQLNDIESINLDEAADADGQTDEAMYNVPAADGGFADYGGYGMYGQVADLGWGDDIRAPDQTTTAEEAQVARAMGLGEEGEDDEAAEIVSDRQRIAQLRQRAHDQRMQVDEAVDADDVEDIEGVDERRLMNGQQSTMNEAQPGSPEVAIAAQQVDEDAGNDGLEADADYENLVKTITFNCQSIAQTIRGNTEPTKEICSVVEVLLLNAKPMLNVLTRDEELCAEMIRAYHSMAEAMLTEQIIMDMDYLVAIFRFFHVLIVEFYGPLIDRLDMCQLGHILLNDGTNLYQAISPQPTTGKRARGASANKSAASVQEEKKREDMRETLNYEAEKKVYERIASEAQWRMSLKPGDYLDALSQYKTPMSSQYNYIVGWCRAKVLDIVDGDSFTIGFLGRSADANLIVKRDKESIAPLGTYTQEKFMKWKETIEENQLIDACDDYGVWYKSTLHRRYLLEDVLDCEGEQVEMFHIQCRYPDPEGQKEKDGVKVTGWLRDDFDLFLQKSAPCLRPFSSYTTQYFSVAPEDMKYDLDIPDQEDPLYQTDKIAQYANYRRGHYGSIKFMGKIFDEFGLKGGFDNIVEFFVKIANGDLKTSVEHISYVMVLMARTMPFWTREFMCTRMAQFNTSFLAAMGTTQGSNPLNQPHSRVHINRLTNNYHVLLRRYYVSRKHTRMVNYLSSLIGCSLLKLENLEKRIFGIKLIGDQITSLPYLDQSLKKKEEIVADFISLRAFEIIFSSKNYHLQILQRAEDVLRLYAQTQSLTPELIDLLWETRGMDETACISVYSIIGECILGMQREIVSYVVDKVKEITPSILQLRDVEMLHTIGKSSTYPAQSRYCADALWEIVFNQRNGYTRTVLKSARKKLCDLLQLFQTDTKLDFIQQCVYHLSDPTVISLDVLKIFIKTLNWLPKHQNWGNSKSITMKIYVTELFTNDSLVDILLQDLESYKESVMKVWHSEDIADSNVLQPRTIETLPLFIEGYTHSKNLDVRLNGILFVLDAIVIQGPRITAEQLQRLWDILITNTKLPGDQRAFFRFFRRVLQEREWLHYSVVCQFFEEKIEQNRAIFTDISLDGFHCIQTMLLYINEFENYINIIKQPQEEKESSSKSDSGVFGSGISSARGNSSRRLKYQRNQPTVGALEGIGAPVAKDSSTQKQKLEFRVHRHPNELRGIEILWLIFTTSPQRDLNLLSHVIHFLAQIYHSTSRVLEADRTQIYADFINESLRRLQESLGEDEREAAEKRDLVKNMMSMLGYSLADTELNGSCAIRPHANIDTPCQIIDEITVQSFLPKEGHPKYFQLRVDGRMTVWELIDYIAKKLNHSPRKIKLQRSANNTMVSQSSKKPDFIPIYHSNTLIEMKVESGEEFSVMRNFASSERVPLTNPQTKKMVPDVKIIFEQWFDTFSRPKEEFEDAESLTEDRYMDKKGCVQLMISTVKDQRVNANSAASPDSYITEHTSSIRVIFEDYDSDEDGRLTKSDFLRFYQTKCLQNPNIVWQNLEKQHIGKDLMAEHVDQNDVPYMSDASVVRKQEDLPRFFISATPQMFDSLLDLELQLQSLPPMHVHESMKSVWTLIGRLKTSPQLYLSLLKNEHLEERLGRPGQQSNYRLLYTLQIIFNLIAQYRNQQTSTANLYYEPQKLLYGNTGAANDYDKEFPGFEEQKKSGNDAVEGGKGPATAATGKSDGGATKSKFGASIVYDEQDEYAKGQGQGADQGGSVAIPHKDQDAVGSEGVVNRQAGSNSGNNLTHSKRQIQGWKGEIIQENIDVSQVSDEELIEMLRKEINLNEEAQAEDQELLAAAAHKEMLENAGEQLKELKKEWLFDFLAKNGFGYLLEIIKQIIGKYSQTENKQEILAHTAEVGTLRLTAYLIKVILTPCFCSQTKDSNLAGNLQRKMSMRGDSNVARESALKRQQSMQPQNELITKQKSISNEFQLLTQLFEEDIDQRASQLLESLNLAQLQDLLQSTVRVILKKQSLIGEQDRQVVAECLDILVSCITFDSQLLLSIYGDNEDENTEIVTMLIEQGLFSEMGSLRKQFKEAIEFMCFNIKTGSLPQPPALFFLQKLLGQVQSTKEMSFTRTPDFFDLLKKLLDYYFKMREREPMNYREIFDPAMLTKDLIRQLELYKSQETKTSIIADHTLVGLLNLVQSLLVSNYDILTQNERSAVMNMLVKQCLFNQAQQAYQWHIMGNIDLSQHESSQVNKCHTDESRNAAYSLLDTVINYNSDPTVIQTLVEDFWNPFILQLRQQKEQGVAPQNAGRSPYRFVGLKNLGCICYMNSMMQQLFNVPAFRYSLLAADDREMVDMQTDQRGEQVDNNSLHQWLKMFSFLQLTDRQEYNPVEFCFAFKELGGNPMNVRVQQDAQEYLNLGFDRLEKLLKDTPQKYLCQNAFQGQIASLTVCKSCGNIVCTEQEFYTLQLQVKNQKTIASSLESMIAGEIIEEYNCSACHKKVTIEKKQCIRNLPNTLILHLNRIVFDFDTMRNKKLNDKLEFPNELNVRPFMLPQVLSEMKKRDEEAAGANMPEDSNAAAQDDGEDGEKGASIQKQQSDAVQQQQQDEEERQARLEDQAKLQRFVQEGLTMADEEFDYKLVGVVIHMGIADAGHYISYVNTERECDPAENRRQWFRTDQQTWLEFNDSIVSGFDFNQMQFKAFGEDQNDNQGMVVDYTEVQETVQQSHNAYMLVYEKAEKKPLKIICPEETVKLIKAQPEQMIKKVSAVTDRGAKQALSCDGTAIPRDNIKGEEEEEKKEGEVAMVNAHPEDGGDEDRKDTDVQMKSAQDNSAQPADTEMESTQASLPVSRQSKKAVSAEDDVNEQAFADFVAQVPHSFLIYPGLINRIYHDQEAVKLDQKTKESYVEVPFHHVQTFVPNEYYRQVHADNQLFLAEKQVFCSPFFNTSAQLIEQYLNSIDEEENTELTQAKRYQVYKVLDKLIFDMLVNGTDEQQKSMPKMMELFFRIIDQSPEALTAVIKTRIMVGIDEMPGDEDNQEQMIDTTTANKKVKTLNDKVFFDQLLTGKTPEVRDLHEQVLSRIILVLFSKLEHEEAMVDRGYVQDIILRVTNEMLELIGTEAHKFWHKIGSFLNFFHTMVQDGNIGRITYFVQQNLINRLMDLTCRFNAQIEFVAPPFEKLVATICIIVRCQPLVIYLFGIPEEYQPSEEEVRAELAEQRVSMSPHYLKYQEGPAGGLFLPLRDLRCVLLLEKRVKEFYTITLKHSSESQNIAWLMGHLCWGNYEVSRRMGKVILKGLNNTNELEVRPYVECMKVYLSLQDQYQEERVEWLMGISSCIMIRQRQGGGGAVNNVGANVINLLDDPICEYHTTLYKQRSEVLESVLTMMFKYRKEKFVRAALALLEGVSWIIANSDHNNVLFKYLLSMDPPAYTCRRYWDWIEPHIMQHIQHCSDNNHLASSEQELETSVRIYTNLETIKQNYGPLLDPESGLCEQGPSGRRIPDPYIMWDIDSDQQIWRYPDNPDSKIYVQLHECRVNCQKSRPTGSRNESIQRLWQGARVRFVPKPQRKKGMRQVGQARGRRQGYGASSKRHTQAATEEERQSRRTNVHQQNTRRSQLQDQRHDADEADDDEDDEIIEGRGGLDYNGENDESRRATAVAGIEGQPAAENHPEAADNEDTAEPDPQNPIVAPGAVEANPTVNMFEEPGLEGDAEPQQPITDSEMQNQQNNNFGENDEVADVTDPEQLYEGGEEEVVVHQVEDDSNDDDDVEEEKNDGAGEEDLSQGLGAQNDLENQDKGAALQNPYRQEPEMEQFDEEVEDPRSQEYALLVFLFKNDSRQDARVTIAWNQEARNKVNFRMPVTDFTEVIKGDMQALPLKLAKLKLGQNWGEYLNFSIQIDQLNGEKFTRYDRDYPNIRERKLPMVRAAVELEQQMLAAQQQQQQQDQQDQQDLYGDGQAQFSPPRQAAPDVADEDFGKINCNVCTFLNDPSNNACEVCGSQM